MEGKIGRSEGKMYVLEERKYIVWGEERKESEKKEQRKGIK